MQTEYEIGAKNNLENKLLFWRRYAEYVKNNSGEIKLHQANKGKGNINGFTLGIKNFRGYAEIKISGVNEIRISLSSKNPKNGKRFYDYLCTFETQIKQDILRLNLPGKWVWWIRESDDKKPDSYIIKFVREVPYTLDVTSEKDYFNWLYQISIFFMTEFSKHYDKYNQSSLYQ